MELGTKYKPRLRMYPFKTILSNMIEALEAGADTLLMTHGLCRLRCYGELLEQILRDLGYQFDFIDLSDYDMGKKKAYSKLDHAYLGIDVGSISAKGAIIDKKNDLQARGVRS